MNRNGNANSLPFHFGTASNSRRPGLVSNPSSTSIPSAITKRISPIKFIVLVSLCVFSLLALTRPFASRDDSTTTEPAVNHKDKETSDQVDRELVVQQILDSRKSAYSFDDFTEEGLRLPQNEHLLPATAILLGWKRIDSLKLLVSYLVRYPYIKEIIVWNNNKELKLSKRDFEMDTRHGPLPELQVYNAAENLHDFAKYMSCSLAKYEHCYFQDDDWLNTHMDSLYTNFLTSPNLIHTNTLPLIQMEHRRWTFTNEDYNMHAGFSWMGTGSYLPREKARRLLEQRGNTTLAKDRFKVIDMYFSIWTNQYPYQLVNYLTPLDQKNDWGAEGVNDHWGIVFRNMLDAADRLYSILLTNFEVTNRDPFARQEEEPYVRDRHTRAPCFNDKCLFMTSLDPFPDPKEVVFKGDLRTIDEQDAKFLELDYPTAEFWKTFAYVHAVDNDPWTCWNSFKVPQAGDSFGLRFVRPTALDRLTVTSSKALTSLEGQITILASDHHGIHWSTCQHSTRYPFAHTMTLDISCPSSTLLPKGVLHQIKVQLDVDLEKSLEICGMDVGGMVLYDDRVMSPKGYTFCYYVSGHGFGHATRVNQVITELLKSTDVQPQPTKTTNEQEYCLLSTLTTTTTTTTDTRTTIPRRTSTSRHTIYIVSDAPQFIFQDVIALGAVYRNARVDAGVVQPLAYSVDRQSTIEGVKLFLARREDMLQFEVNWLRQVGAHCVLADAPFLPCAAASALGIPACLITNFTFDEVYRYLREGDPLDKDVIACADAALEDYKKATLLLRLPGSIDIPSFEDEVKILEADRPHHRDKFLLPKHSTATAVQWSRHSNGVVATEDDIYRLHQQKPLQTQDKTGRDSPMQEEDTVMEPPSPQQVNIRVLPSNLSVPVRDRQVLSIDTAFTKPRGLTRIAIDVPMVVRKAINTREDVLRALGVDEETIRAKKMVLVSFGGQRLKQGWGNPLPEGWIGVICGLPVSHELPDGFYRSPHGVYVPDLTHAADIVIGKLGYGTCSECIAHDTALIYVSRPQFIEEHGLIKMMIKHGLPVEMTAEEFETGLWQRSILEADRLTQEEKAGRKQFMEERAAATAAALTVGRRSSGAGASASCGRAESVDSKLLGTTTAAAAAVNGQEIRRKQSLSFTMHPPRACKARSLAESVNMAELARGGPISPHGEDEDNPPLLSPARSRRSVSISTLSSATLPSKNHSSHVKESEMLEALGQLDVDDDCGQGLDGGVLSESGWFERRIPHNGGEVCARLLEEYMSQWD
ncbi:hypothetical protein BGX29_003231 [Mortierella sp. GBA35]|nr:hypothetical protein BGX29_003231 [Mortierella sp. GBA35]